MKTNKDIEYMTADYRLVIIPKGTAVIPADNLPQPNESEIAYWAEPWPRMHDDEKSHMRTYGFGIRKEDVTV